jgi:hypothetical protein
MRNYCIVRVLGKAVADARDAVPRSELLDTFTDLQHDARVRISKWARLGVRLRIIQLPP